MLPWLSQQAYRICIRCAYQLEVAGEASRGRAGFTTYAKRRSGATSSSQLKELETESQSLSRSDQIEADRNGPRTGPGALRPVGRTPRTGPLRFSPPTTSSRIGKSADSFGDLEVQQVAATYVTPPDVQRGLPLRKVHFQAQERFLGDTLPAQTTHAGKLSLFPSSRQTNLSISKNPDLPRDEEFKQTSYEQTTKPLAPKQYENRVPHLPPNGWQPKLRSNASSDHQKEHQIPPFRFWSNGDVRASDSVLRPLQNAKNASQSPEVTQRPQTTGLRSRVSLLDQLDFKPLRNEGRSNQTETNKIWDRPRNTSKLPFEEGLKGFNQKPESHVSFPSFKRSSDSNTGHYNAHYGFDKRAQQDRYMPHRPEFLRKPLAQDEIAMSSKMDQVAQRNVAPDLNTRREPDSLEGQRPERKAWQEKKDRKRETRADRREEKFASEEEDEANRLEQEAIAAEMNKRRQKRMQKEQEKKQKQSRSLELPAFVSVGRLATLLSVQLETFQEKLKEFGYEDTRMETNINSENASLIASEYGFEVIVGSDVDDLKPLPKPVDTSLLPSRPPVVTIMGHVDHGKTTLLDFLRKSSVAASEHGGITQHIGAFSVQMRSGKVITFLDTPGHAAFLNMRQRGANVTDIVVLVVAADDSVKQQTIEAIKHAKAARVPIIVAINKVDKEDAKVDKVKQDLIQHDIEVEDFGGDVQAIPVSGKTGLGMDDLEEAIVTQAEIIDMRADQQGVVEGWVIEAMTKRAGRIATVLVRRGTLRAGTIVVAGTTWARVRTLKNEAGAEIDEAGPGQPVEVDGWREQPIAGDEVLQAPNEQRATSAVEYRLKVKSQDQAAADMDAISEYRRLEGEKREREKEEEDAKRVEAELAGKRYKRIHKNLTNVDLITHDPSKKTLLVAIKADTSGSAEAVEAMIKSLALAHHPVMLNFVRIGVGQISESDVDAVTSGGVENGLIVSFNQPIPQDISAAADRTGLRIMDHNIIYKVVDDVRGFVEARLPPNTIRRVTAEAEALQIFDINIKGRKYLKVCGSKVRNGTIVKGTKVSVYRGQVGDPASVVFTGKSTLSARLTTGNIDTLKSHKKDVDEIRKGSECGLSFEGWESFLPGDIIQAFVEVQEPRRIEF